MGVWTREMDAEIRAVALEAGFALAGLAHAEGVQPTLEGQRFVGWVEAGRAGDMDYLKRRNGDGMLLRSGVRVAMPWARSVVVCALDYASEEVRSVDEAPAGAGWIGRYAWTGKAGNLKPGTGNSDSGEQAGGMVATDYHLEMLGRLRVVEGWLQARVECETKCYVDTGPIVEREFAAKAGVGWIGKNTCVINQTRGSWLLLGVIVTSLEVPEEIGIEIAADRCGSCTRCIEACPTAALVAPREMDARRCIAYLTIEKKDVIPEELREGMGRQVFGCDICQDVCPWNEKRENERRRNGKEPVIVTPGMEVRRELVNPSLEWLAEIGPTEFKRWFKGSPLERTGNRRLKRNVAIAMGNTGMAEFLPRLRSWAEGEDAVLAEAALWAMGRIESASIGKLGSG